jgi:hypothetical protein
VTKAMKTMLRELMGYRTGNVFHHPKKRALIVTRADLRAAETLQNLGIVRIEGRHAFLERAVSDVR